MGNSIWPGTIFSDEPTTSMHRFDIGEKVYHNGELDQPGEILDYNEYTGDYQIKTANNTFWTSGYSWTREGKCTHKWKVHQGLFEKDYYCEKCNEKRDWNNPPEGVK